MLAQKYPSKAFLFPNLGIFIILEILQLDKFEGPDFVYENNMFKFEPQNKQIWHF